MKILALDQGEHMGGAERFFSELLTHYADFSEHEITLLHDGSDDYRKLYQNSQVKLIHQDLPRLKPIGLRTFFRYRKSKKELQEKIQEYKPDILISNTVRTHILVSKIASNLKIPLIWLGHDLTFPKFLLKKFLQHPRLILCCSHFVKEHYSQFTEKKEKFQVMYPFGIESRQLRELIKRPKKKTFGMVGKWIPWKGQEQFIQLAKKIHDVRPMVSFTLVASVYDGKKESLQYRDMCLQLISKLGLEDSFSVQSHNPKIMREMASWKGLIHSSIEPEPLGRVILEGMAAGCTVFAADQGGPREIIQQSSHCKSWVPSDPESVLEEIINIVDSDEVLKEADEWLKSNLTWKEQMKKFDVLVSQTIKA